jgi:hypothetical protein
MDWEGTRISLSRPRNAPGPVESIQLGGTKLWSAGDFDLGAAVDCLERHITECAEINLLTSTRAVIKKQVAQCLGQDSLDDRVFGAVLGQVQRKGVIDELLLASRYDRPFRAYFGTVNGTQVRGWLDAAKTMLRERKQLQVRDLESRMVVSRRYNSWSSALHILAHLSYLGIARQLDSMTFAFVDVSKLTDA